MVEELMFRIVFKHELSEAEVDDLLDRFIVDFVEYKGYCYGGGTSPLRIEGGIYQQSRKFFDVKEMKVELQAFFSPIEFVKEIVFV
jgi:uncharacterized protein YggL (DUF469 family)